MTREAVIAERVVAGVGAEFRNIGDMRRKITVMVNRAGELLDEEEKRIEEGRVHGGFVDYYKKAWGALMDCEEALRKLEAYI